MDYKTCWDLQQELFDAGVARKRTGPIPVPGADGADDAGTVLLVEHPPVYTLGKSGHAENLLVNQEALEAMGAQFFHIDRGGDITFHGPGQLVCYPILDLERIGIGLREYIDTLEEAAACDAALRQPPTLTEERSKFFDALEQLPFQQVRARYLSAVQHREGVGQRLRELLHRGGKEKKS